ncbi:MAG TPA: hypothetical protein EYP19_10315 [Desulfobacterales bacterium]|nr:hypothetical protein [Desulfobacterales bacterium]
MGGRNRKDFEYRVLVQVCHKNADETSKRYVRELDRKIRTKASGHQDHLTTVRMAVNPKQFLLGFCGLFVGLAEYVLSRPTDSTYLGTAIEALGGDFPFKIDIFGVLGGVLPEFVHPFSFALITMALFPQASKNARRMICLFWLVLELLFEIGQFCGNQIAQYVPRIFDHLYVLANLRSYLLNGTYDHLDVLAICLGITAAYAISERISIQGGTPNERGVLEHRNGNKFKKKHQGPVLETGS